VGYEEKCLNSNVVNKVFFKQCFGSAEGKTEREAEKKCSKHSRNEISWLLEDGVIQAVEKQNRD